MQTSSAVWIHEHKQSQWNPRPNACKASAILKVRILLLLAIIYYIYNYACATVAHRDPAYHVIYKITGTCNSLLHMHVQSTEQ